MQICVSECKYSIACHFERNYPPAKMFYGIPIRHYAIFSPCFPSSSAKSPVIPIKPVLIFEKNLFITNSSVYLTIAPNTIAPIILLPKKIYKKAVLIQSFVISISNNDDIFACMTRIEGIVWFVRRKLLYEYLGFIKIKPVIADYYPSRQIY